MTELDDGIITLQRQEVLIRGEVSPINLCEELFVLAYKNGLAGELLLNVILEIADIFDETNGNEKDHFLLGYARGQKDISDAEDDLEEYEFNTNKVH